MLDRSLEAEFESYRKTLSTDEARRAMRSEIANARKLGTAASMASRRGAAASGLGHAWILIAIVIAFAVAIVG